MLICLTVIGLLTALLFPAFASARRKAQDSSCLNNLHQLGLAIQIYTDDYDGRYPFALDPIQLEQEHDVWWGYPNDLFHQIPSYTSVLKPYVKSPLLFGCPRDNGGEFYNEQVANSFKRWGTSYQYNRFLIGDAFMEQSVFTLAEIESANPSRLELLRDMGSWHENQSLGYHEYNYHVQIIYADMHAARVLQWNFLEDLVVTEANNE